MVEFEKSFLARGGRVLDWSTYFECWRPTLYYSRAFCLERKTMSMTRSIMVSPKRLGRKAYPVVVKHVVVSQASIENVDLAKAIP